MSGPRVMQGADVSPSARIGEGSVVWGLAQVREDAEIGLGCVIGRGAYVDAGVRVGDRCKLQNFALVYAPAVLGDGVFVGPGAVLTNDRHPRATTPDGAVKSGDDWTPAGVVVGDGASIGAHATVVAGVRLGAWSMVAAGAVVASDVPAHALVAGVPARQQGWVGAAGHRLAQRDGEWVCPSTGTRYVEGADGLREQP